MSSTVSGDAQVETGAVSAAPAAYNEPSSLESFAREQPLAFLAAAAGAGVVARGVVRGLLRLRRARKETS